MRNFLFFLFFSISVFAQNYKPEILQFTDGLPSDAVFMTVKKDGFLYIATQKGLCMYDGYIFVNSRDLPSAIFNITQKGNRIYGEEAGTGLFEIKDIYSKKKVIANVVYTDASADNDHYSNIYKDNLGNVWCSDFHFLKYYNLKTGKHKVFRITNDNKQLNITIQYIENENELLISTSKGFFVWNKKTDILYKKSAINFSAAFKKQDRNFLLSENVKLYEYISATGKVEFLNELNVSQQFFAVNGFSKEDSVMLYDDKKLYQYYTSLNKIEEIYVSEDRINHVMYDEVSKIFWISTQRGLVKLVNDQSIIRTLQTAGEKNVPVTDILVFNKEIYAVKNSKILLKNQDNNWLQTGGNFEKINRLSVSGGKLLVAVNSGVLEKNGNEEFKKIINTDFPVKKAVYFDGKYWLMPENAAIKVYDGKTLHELSNFLKNDENFWKINLFNDFEISGNKLWLASWMPRDYGISYFDKKESKFLQISKIAGNKDLFVSDYYNKAKKLKNGNVIFSSTGGFNIVNPSGKIVYAMNTRVEKIASDNIVGIAEDAHGNIWFGCAEGLYQFNLKTKTAVRISKTDGLFSNNLVYGFYISPDNFLYVSNEKNLEKVDLNKILKTELINQLKLTSVKLNNEFLPYLSDNISLKEKDATQIEYFFSALSFSGKDKIVHRYRFDDEEWNYLGSIPKLSLIKLTSGKYKITIEAGDNLGNWQKKNLVLQLEIVPPFYKTIWFFLLIALLLSMLIFGVNRYLVFQEKQKGILKKKAKETENKMLRSQMNPHFLFNSLNSINSFIIQNKGDEAEKYLTSFSKLMRNILDNSRKDNISLQQELETIKLYLDLEAVRMEHKFDYRINVSKEIETDLVQIPPLIFQPFLENAIWHGINHKEGKGFIEINVKENPDNKNQLIINIQDDGIGREVHLKKKKSGNSHKSHGLEITKERLRMQDPENVVEIIDLYDEKKHATGTLIIIKIKIKHD